MNELKKGKVEDCVDGSKMKFMEVIRAVISSPKALPFGRRKSSSSLGKDRAGSGDGRRSRRASGLMGQGNEQEGGEEDARRGMVEKAGEQFMEKLKQLRSERDEENMMLLLEGEFIGVKVFVRDVRLSREFHGSEEEIKRQLDLVGKLQHANLTNIFFTHCGDGRIVTIAERAVESVFDKIYKSRSVCFEECLTKDDALEIALSVCLACMYLHGLDIYDLNLKPSSVLCFEDGTYKLAESCFTKLISGASLSRTVTSKYRGQQQQQQQQMLHQNHYQEDDIESDFNRTNSQASLEEVESEDSIAYFNRQQQEASFDYGKPGLSPTSSTGATFGTNNTFPSDATNHFIQYPEYQAPEILMMQDETTKKADVFSFGMLLWQLLHLRSAYPKEFGPFMILRNLQSGERPTIDPTIVPINSPLRKLIQSCWATNPNERPSFEQVHQMLLIAKKNLQLAQSNELYNSSFAYSIHMKHQKSHSSISGSMHYKVDGQYRPHRHSTGSFHVSHTIRELIEQHKQQQKYQSSSSSSGELFIDDSEENQTIVDGGKGDDEFHMNQIVSFWNSKARQYQVGVVQKIIDDSNLPDHKLIGLMLQLPTVMASESSSSSRQHLLWESENNVIPFTVVRNESNLNGSDCNDNKIAQMKAVVVEKPPFYAPSA